MADDKPTAAETSYRVVQVVITGPPRWGEAKRWIVDAGPPYYQQIAGPFTSRREALEILAELVNEAYA